MIMIYWTNILDKFTKQIKTRIFVAFCLNFNVNTPLDNFGWENRTSENFLSGTLVELPSAGHIHMRGNI